MLWLRHLVGWAPENIPINEKKNEKNYSDGSDSNGNKRTKLLKRPRYPYRSKCIREGSISRKKWHTCPVNDLVNLGLSCLFKKWEPNILFQATMEQADNMK